MCAVVGHQVAEFNTAISCPVNNLRCNRWVQHMITWISRHHSTQGKVESEDLAWSFCWCASIRTGMARENNSSFVLIAQLSSINNAVRFAWFHRFSNYCLKRTHGPPVGVDPQPEALALSEENSPISSWFHSISIHDLQFSSQKLPSHWTMSVR